MFKKLFPILVVVTLLFSGCSWHWPWVNPVDELTTEQKITQACDTNPLPQSVSIEGSVYDCPTPETESTVVDTPQDDASAVVPPTATPPVEDSLDMTENDHGNNPQVQIGHPNYYVETGVQGQVFTWTLEIADGEFGIVGGWSVNNIDGGTYQGFGPGRHIVHVIDGFALITKADWAPAEWNFRIGQAEEYGWAHANQDPGPIAP